MTLNIEPLDGIPESCSQIVSTTFYDNKLKTAEELKLKRRSPNPCKWIDVSGGETKHKGRVRHAGILSSVAHHPH